MASWDPRTSRAPNQTRSDPPKVHSFAALGDSFTAGTGCPPEARWADRLALALGRRKKQLVYRNFAEDGATSAEVAQQLERALEMQPDLVTVICGVNDVLHSVRPDILLYAARLNFMFEQLKVAARVPLVVTATAPEHLNFLELGPRSTRRLRSGLRRLNEETRRLADKHRVICLEVAGHPGLDDPENFLADGLHPSLIGHWRAAEIFKQLLGDHPWATDERRAP